MSEAKAGSPGLRILRFIWLQQIVTIIVLGAIGPLVQQDVDPVLDNLPMYTFGCGLLAVASISIGLYLRRYYAGTMALPLLMPAHLGCWKNGLNTDQINSIQRQANHLYKTITIAGTAFAEGAAVFGLVLAWMANMPILYAPFGGLAAIFILWQFPNNRALEAICGGLIQQKRVHFSG